jgi:copper chaperone
MVASGRLHEIITNNNFALTVQSIKEKPYMKTILRSQGLSCPSCIAKIEKALKNLPGVQDATVHFNSGRIEVQHDAELVKQEELVKAVRAAGYETKVSPF